MEYVGWYLRSSRMYVFDFSSLLHAGYGQIKIKKFRNDENNCLDTIIYSWSIYL